MCTVHAEVCALLPLDFMGSINKTWSNIWVWEISVQFNHWTLSVYSVWPNPLAYHYWFLHSVLIFVNSKRRCCLWEVCINIRNADYCFRKQVSKKCAALTCCFCLGCATMSTSHYFITKHSILFAETWYDDLYSTGTTCQMAIRMQVDTRQLIWYLMPWWADCCLKHLLTICQQSSWKQALNSGEAPCMGTNKGMFLSYDDVFKELMSLGI